MGKKTSQRVFLEGPDTFQLDVVGESHYQDNLSFICANKPAEGLKTIATLVLEDDNRHDSKAVRVDIDELAVGHLKRENAREYRRLVTAAGHGKANAKCRAIIHGGGPDKFYGVWLDLPVEDGASTTAPRKPGLLKRRLSVAKIALPVWLWAVFACCGGSVLCALTAQLSQ